MDLYAAAGRGVDHAEGAAKDLDPRGRLEPIPKMSQGLAERDERAGEVEEAEVVGADSFPAHEQPAEAVVPCVGPLHDPSARLALDAAQERRNRTAMDIWRRNRATDPARSQPGERDAKRGSGEVDEAGRGLRVSAERLQYGGSRTSDARSSAVSGDKSFTSPKCHTQ